MGVCASKKEKRVLMLGLDGAGKTTILYQLKLGEVITTIATVGFNVEEIYVGGLSLVTWEVGGQEKIRPLWRHYYCYNDVLIFVVDSTDRKRMQVAADELHGILNHEDIGPVSVLIFANKQDKQDAMSVDEIKDALRLAAVQQTWHVLGTCATTGEGLHEGLQWAVQAMKSTRAKK